MIEEPEQTKPKNAKEVVEKAKRMKDAKDVRSGAEYYKKWDKVADDLQKVRNSEQGLIRGDFVSQPFKAT